MGRHKVDKVYGVLIREVSVRVLEISLSGCLIESRQQLIAGVCGQLQVELSGQTCTEDIRISRCRLVEGAGPLYRAGAEFVGMRDAEARSIRAAVRALH